MKALPVGFYWTANVTLPLAGYSWMDRRCSPLASVQEATRMTRIQSVALPDIAELHVQFLAILPSIERYAELAHRHLVNFHDREDAIAETIAVTWAWYYRLARRRKHTLASPTVLVHIAIRSVRAGRPLCCSNGIRQRNGILVSEPS